MAHVKITQLRFGVKVEVDGQEINDVRKCRLNFSTDGLPIVVVEAVVELPFEWEGAASFQLHPTFILPEGCELIEITKMGEEGRVRRVIRVREKA